MVMPQSVKVDDADHDLAKRVAEREQRSIMVVIGRALRAYAAANYPPAQEHDTDAR